MSPHGFILNFSMETSMHHDLISHSVTLSWHWANQSLPYPNNAERQTRKQQLSTLKSLVWLELGSKTVRSRHEPATFGLPDSPEWEAHALHIQSPILVFGILGGKGIFKQFSPPTRHLPAVASTNGVKISAQCSIIGVQGLIIDYFYQQPALWWQCQELMLCVSAYYAEKALQIISTNDQPALWWQWKELMWWLPAYCAEY